MESGVPTLQRNTGEHARAEYGCAVCGRRFVLAMARPELPPHSYPRGLLRGRRCPSSYGVRLA